MTRNNMEDIPPKRIVAIHQPNFIPWLGYFHKIVCSDIFVVLDNVEFTKGGFTNRNKIKYSNGKANWLTIPVKVSKSLKQMINEVEIDNKHNWKDKHLKTLKMNYSKAKYLDRYYEEISEIYREQSLLISDLNIRLLKFILEILEIRTQIIFASEIELTEDSKSSELLFELCKSLQADIYLSGEGARKYLDEALFVRQNKIEIIYQKFEHPVYPQLYGDFIPNLSIIDLIFNCGPDSKTVLLSTLS